MTTENPLILGTKEDKDLGMQCAACDLTFGLPEFPFGSNVQCPHCGAVMETDFDESVDGLLGPWATNVVNVPSADEHHD